MCMVGTEEIYKTNALHIYIYIYIIYVKDTYIYIVGVYMYSHKTYKQMIWKKARCINFKKKI